MEIMTDQRIADGDILARKYRVERVLGKGAMGVVVAATHVDLGQLVALKLMHADKEEAPEMRARFLREARAAVRLKSQHIAKVLDVGTDENDMPYIAMEFLEGQDLAVILKKKGRQSFDDAVEYILQACEAVGEAHAAGIVHRDLKPANMFLTRDVSGAACIKVLDFGISKVMGAELTLTQEAQALGSPMYMSPEALGSAKGVDTRTDIWALGIILYQLVAGKTPFHESTMGQLCTRIVIGSPTPLAEYRPDAPPGFEAVIHRCLQRDRDQRYENVAAFAHAIAPFAPPRARVYVERIARIMGVDLDKLGSNLPPVDPSELQATLPISARPQALLATLPGAGATSQTGGAVTAASVSSTIGVPAKPKSQLPLILGAALAIAIPGAYLILSNRNAPQTNVSSPSVASPSEAMTAPPPTNTSAIATTAVLPAPSAIATASATSAPVEALPSPTATATTTATAKPVATTKATARPIKNSKVPDYDERQ
jgi:eukaryotic-like serine/threonine-protein kinase